MKYLIFFLVFVIAIVATACSDNAKTTGAATVEINLKCDDKNECTEDSYDESLGICLYKFKSNCCGNNICEPRESCSKDCSAMVGVEDYKCEGSCSIGNGVIKIKGDTKVIFNVVNNGNRDVLLNAHYECSRIRGGFIPFENYGLKVRGYFVGGGGSVKLGANSNFDYIIEFSGKPTIKTELGCNLYLDSQNSLLSEVFYIILEP